MINLFLNYIHYSKWDKDVSSILDRVLSALAE